MATQAAPTLADIPGGDAAPGTALTTRPIGAGGVTATRLGLLRPIAEPAQVMEQQNELRQYLKQVLQEGRDYGEIPGVDKPSLLKPGAERINNGFGVIPVHTIVEQEIDHDREVPWLKRKKVWRDGQWTGEWSEERGTSYGLYRYVVRCELVHRESGVVVAQCLASCSSMESKYIDRPRDSENTVLKMAEKRAFVGATLLAYGLSDEFTQDVEETGVAAANGNGAEGGPAKVTPPTCSVHGRPMKDQRATKKNPRQPDWKCTQVIGQAPDGKKLYCDEVKWPGQWPPKEGAAGPAANSTPSPGTPTNGTPTNGTAPVSTAASESPRETITRETKLTFGGPELLGKESLASVGDAFLRWCLSHPERRVPQPWREAVLAEAKQRRLVAEDAALADLAGIAEGETPF